tara:strand:+ start:44 stop:157 length:114 start_codon:yes stop_codon:yes gene_type:complete
MLLSREQSLTWQNPNQDKEQRYYFSNMSQQQKITGGT